jgi:hypothetical protein
MDGHRGCYKNWKKGGISNKTRSFEIFEEYGVEKCEIILLELYPCQTKDELKSKEAEYIKTNPCVNKNIPNQTKKEWRELNKDYLLENIKEYKIINADKLCESCICNCGGKYQFRFITVHKNTKRHLKYINDNPQFEEAIDV